MPIQGDELVQAIRRYWTGRFDLKLEAWNRPGTKLMRDEIFEGSGEIYLYRLGEHALLRMDPAQLDQIDWPGDLKTRSLGAEELVGLAPGEFTIRHGDIDLNYYLDPERFSPAPALDAFPTRPVDPARDDALLRELLDACSEEDIENAEIDLKDPDAVIYGSFHEGRMVAYAGHRYWGENIADIGVLTHPDFRQHGLGKAGVTTLCRWCIDNEVIPMYRVESEHFRSRKIAEALGFDMLVEITVLKTGS